MAPLFTVETKRWVVLRTRLRPLTPTLTPTPAPRSLPPVPQGNERHEYPPYGDIVAPERAVTAGYTTAAAAGTGKEAAL